jgi:hypothetical protein
MAQQSINIGAAANDGSGDPLRTAFDKINDNFSELYTVSGAGPGNNLALSGNSIISEDSSGDIILDPNGTGRVVVATASELRFTDHVDNAVAYVDADGDIQFSSSLTFDGTDLVAGSAKVSDLTSGRITYASTAGALVDNANLTFDGSTLTAASIVASDITDNRVVFGGTAGLLEDSANLTFDGTTLTVGGQLSFNDNRISTINSNENIDLDPSGTGTVNFAVPTQTTVGSAGGASNVPAAPTVYVKIRVSGVEYVIPAFAVS